MKDPPPAYTPVASTSTAILAQEAELPHDCQRALAPLTLVSPHVAIRGCYNVCVAREEIGDNDKQHRQADETCTDVTLDSETSAVDVAVYFEGNKGKRPIKVFATSHNGSIKLKLPRKLRGQHFEISCVCAYGTVTIYLPHNYDGIITAGSQYASVMLDPQMQRNSCILPLGRGADLCAKRYRIRPFSPNLSAAEYTGSEKSKSVAMAPSGLGEDVCQLTANSGNIYIGYVKAEKDSACCVM